MAPVDEKTPPDGLRAMCAATQRAVEVVEKDVDLHERRLWRLEFLALPSWPYVLAMFVVGFLLGLIVGRWA